MSVIFEDVSQSKELDIIKPLIDSSWPRFIVDVGANDGIIYSNSLPFVQAGWRSLLIEPYSDAFRKLQQNCGHYANATLLNVGCFNKETTKRLYMGCDTGFGLLSTMCSDNNEWFDFARTDEYEEVKVKPLECILKKHGFPVDYSILSVDTEGLDYEVLQAAGLERYKPRIIITEIYTYSEEKQKGKHELLSKHGYTLYDITRTNEIWLHSDQDLSLYVSEVTAGLLAAAKQQGCVIGSRWVEYARVFAKETSMEFAELETIKSPKWLDDALLCKITSENNPPLTLKIHEEKYPVGGHIYRNRKLLDTLEQTGYVPKIYNSFVSSIGVPYRFTLYKYVDGISLGEFVRGASSEEISLVRHLLKRLTRTLLISGFNVFIRDLDDFLLREDALGRQNIVLTDINAVFDVHEASSYSTIKVMDILNKVIDDLVTSEYEQYSTERPTLT